MRKRRVNFISLGCSKNLVDTERLMKTFNNEGYDVAHESAPKSHDITVINTCGFIGDAKEESINTILDYLELKKKGNIDAVYVMGCLSQRYLSDLQKELPEVDGWSGKFDYAKIVENVTRKEGMTLPIERVQTTLPHYTYIKVAEGCNRFCAFCAIPLITGRFKSRSIEEILQEVESFVAKGVKEFNVLAQDLSSYGLDIYGKKSLAELIDRMAQIRGVEMIRLHYAYPADFPHDVLDVMAKHPNVCKYLDIALQHISDKVLENMRRHITGKETRELIAEIRRKVPGIHLRTTLMVGFPGEGEEEFAELLDFVRETRFERMGAFAYCEEDDTYAANHFKDDIPQEVKQARLDKLMKLQEEISMDIQSEKVGRNVRVIIDREDENYYVGRSEWDSPEVDPEVLVRKTKKLIPGKLYNVKILEALPFELIAEINE
ncbi:MAG: 30S ribosomal protein S12 methylthiotransferase RimO [Muribaculaceae bacterium]|nr:30S ribosomal protein S12 methylthiotransferase RimO [Muribaculaceae bacterium]